jgi:seryl-tRNA synthetase
MTAKTYLKQIRALDIKINDGMEELEQLKALSTRVTSAMDGEMVSGTKNPDKMTDVVAKIIKLQEDLNRDVDKYVDIKREANELLSMVENPTHYKILHSRYVLYKTWEQIACEIGFTYQWVCQLHGVALLEFEKILKNSGLLDRN